VPDFDDEEKAEFSLSDNEAASKKKRSKQVEEDKKRDARRERRIIEQLVDDQLQLELNSSVPEGSKSASFRYRETSPKSFGLSSRDILLADDKQLNEFAGLKKLASFRDPEKKKKDQKHLGKKARLRKWRLDTFGNEEGLQASELIPKEEDEHGEEVGADGVDIRTKGKKKRRRNKGKKEKTEVEMEA
jgi:protein KRI1